jgi:hypothetical protein
MIYRGNMGELKETMREAAQALGHLSEIARGVAQTVAPARMGSLDSTSWSSGAPVSSTDNVDNIASVKVNPTNGTTTTIYTDGSVKIVNAQGQDVTANYIGTAPSGGNTLSTIWQDLTTSAGNVATSAGSAATKGLSSLATIAVVAGVVFVIIEMGKRK